MSDIDSPPTKLHLVHTDDTDDDDGDGDSSISLSLLHERHNSSRLPTLPDLRFEQSYLASVAAADGVWWRVALITLKDQCALPLLQGVGYNLAMLGFRSWNRGAKFAGAGMGARVRRWWWGVNKWELPRQ